MDDNLYPSKNQQAAPSAASTSTPPVQLQPEPDSRQPQEAAAVPPSPPVVSSPPPSMPPPSPPSSFPIKKLLIGIVAVLIAGGLLFLIISGVSSFFNKKPEKVTLTYWGLWEDKNTMQSIISDFGHKYPTITIEYVQQDSDQYQQRLLTRVKNGTGPDIFRFHNTWVLPLSGILLPMSSDVITPAEFKTNFYPVAYSDLVKNGAIYGIPIEIDNLALFVNEDILKASGRQVPTDWNDFTRAAQEMTVKDSDGKIKTAGAALGTYSNITHAPDIISLFLAQSGAKFTDFTATSANAQKAFEYYTGFAKSSNNVWNDTLDESIIAFSKGNLAMYLGYSWDIFTIKSMNPNLNFGVYPVPHLPGRDMTIASYWVEGVSAKSKHQKEALLFMKYLTQKETEQKLFAEESKTRLFGEPYARTDLAASVKDNPLVAPFVSQAATAVSSPFIQVNAKAEDSFNAVLNGYMENAINSLLSNSSVQTVVATLAQGVNSVLNQYGR